MEKSGAAKLFMFWSYGIRCCEYLKWLGIVLAVLWVFSILPTDHGCILQLGIKAVRIVQKLVMCELLKIIQFPWVKAMLPTGFVSHCVHKQTPKQLLQSTERLCLEKNDQIRRMHWTFSFPKCSLRSLPDVFVPLPPNQVQFAVVTYPCRDSMIPRPSILSASY